MSLREVDYEKENRFRTKALQNSRLRFGDATACHACSQPATCSYASRITVEFIARSKILATQDKTIRKDHAARFQGKCKHARGVTGLLAQDLNLFYGAPTPTPTPTPTSAPAPPLLPLLQPLQRRKFGENSEDLLLDTKGSRDIQVTHVQARSAELS